MHEDDYKPNATCLHCGYGIDLLGEHRCPECGEPFDPYDWDTYRSERPLMYEPFVMPPQASLTFAVVLLFWSFLAVRNGMPYRLYRLNEGAMIFLVIVPLAAGYGFAFHALTRGKDPLRVCALIVTAAYLFLIGSLAVMFISRILSPW